MTPGTLYKIQIDELFFYIKNTDGGGCSLLKDTILTYIECKFIHKQMNYFFLYDDKILYRGFYGSDIWLLEHKWLIKFNSLPKVIGP